jgi:Fe-S cluster biogenesis protein NfuA
MSSVDQQQLEQAIRFARPRLRGHAGDMSVAVDEGGAAVVTFLGACESCPAMAVTFGGLVSSALEAVDGITTVSAPQVHASPTVLAGIRRRLGVRSMSTNPPLDGHQG